VRFFLLSLLLLAAPTTADPRRVADAPTFQSSSGFGLDVLGRPARAASPSRPRVSERARIVSGELTPSDGRWIELGPPSRQYPRMVADVLHHRLVLFGGLGPYDGEVEAYSNAVWTLATDGPSSWRLLDVQGPAPEPRAGHECVYDPVRHRLIVFGGFRAIPRGDGFLDFRYYDDTWALSLDGAPHWTELSSGGPGPRTIPACAYDAAHDRLVLAGGFYFDDAIQDPDYFGEYKEDVWSLELAGPGGWTDVTPKTPGPGARTFALLAYDGAEGRLVAFGGNRPGGIQGVEPMFDVWALRLGSDSSWQELGAGGEPPLPRMESAAAWDSARRRVLLLGGWFPEGHYYLTDEWTYDVASESWAHTLEGAPTDRLYPGVAFDPASDALYLAFGIRGFLNLNDTWRQASAAGNFAEVSPPGSPHASESASAVFDAEGRRVVTFGGDYYDADYPKTGEGYDGLRAWAVDDGAWSPLAAAGPEPEPRTRAATAFDTHRRRMWVIGGENGVLGLTDAWALELSGSPRWWQAPDGLHPGQRYGLTTAVYDPVDDRVLYFGGDTGPGHDEIWSLSSEGAWSLLDVDAQLPYRLSTNAVLDVKRHRVIVLAGDRSGKEASDLWALDLDGEPSWHALAATGTSPLPVDYGRAVYDARGDRVLLFGGGNGDPFGTQDHGTYELALEGTARWRRLDPSGRPATARWMHVLAFDDLRNRMLVTGGSSA
jgi:hypothetical protein